MSINYQSICNNVIEIAKKTAQYIQSEKGKISAQQIEIKGLNDFVTRVDKTSEKLIIEALEPLVPEAGFIAEENTKSQKGDVYNWIIDPLDGTTNFIHGIPCYCISIALMQENEIVVGVIFEMNLQECFYAWKNGGAFLNGKQIHVSNTNKLIDSLLATGFPYYDYQYLNEYLDLFKHFMKNSHGVRRLGSAAADLAYVAAGRFEGFYEYSLKPWDVAAGALIVIEAGGKVSDFKGGSNYIFGQEIVSSNANIFNEFTEAVSKFMNK
ncbi:MAG TPA: inositol monophosphatase family protein [Bacteroidia bacterium]|nr:inositol monophosphatase family protein [Bacteroidia bacterium]